MMFSETPIECVKKYWDSRPCNIRHSVKDIGTREYFDEVEQRKYFVEPHIPRFAEFDRWKGKKILEIGCGIGTDTINFARSGAKVTAVDLSQSSLEVAKSRASVYGQNITFYHANAESLSEVVPLERYDLVYSFGVIHHTPHPEKVIEEIKKYMGFSSVLKIMVYHRCSWKVLRLLMSSGKFWKLNEIIANNSEAQEGCPVTYSYTKKSVEKLLDGFHIKSSFVDHIFPYSVSHYRRHEYQKVWYFKMMPYFLFRWLESHFGWHLCVEAKLEF